MKTAVLVVLSWIGMSFAIALSLLVMSVVQGVWQGAKKRLPSKRRVPNSKQ